MNFTLPSLIATLLLMANLVYAAELPVTGVQQEKRFQAQNYLFFLPQGYEKSEQCWPLMLFLHGGGECGTNLSKVKANGPPMLVESNPRFPFILVSPQSPGGGWNNETLIALLDDVISNYRVDTNRIYVTGLSIGGYATWSLASAHPGKFAAIVPICGGGNTADAKKLAALPIWAFHGAKDVTVSVQRSREMVAAIRAAGGSVKYTEYPELGHICWPQTYDNPELYQWLLVQNTDKSREAKSPASLPYTVVLPSQQTNHNDVANLQEKISPFNRSRAGASSGKRFLRNMTMADFAKFIAGVLKAPVADQTGLSGRYDIEMTPPRAGGVDGRLERVTGILLNELGLQLIPFAGPFTAAEEPFNTQSVVPLRQSSNTGTSNTNGGFAIKLDHPDAPGLKPVIGDSEPDAQGFPLTVANKIMLIEGSKAQWALEFRKQNTDTPTWQDLLRYLGRGPNGNMSDFTNAFEGEYIIGSVGESAQLRTSPPAFASHARTQTPATQDPSDPGRYPCINLLRLIDSAKQQWALENRKRNTDIPTMEDLRPFLPKGPNGELPVCPNGGVYTIGSVNEKPKCSIKGHVLP